MEPGFFIEMVKSVQKAECCLFCCKPRFTLALVLNWLGISLSKTESFSNHTIIQPAIKKSIYIKPMQFPFIHEARIREIRAYKDTVSNNEELEVNKLLSQKLKETK